MKDINIQHNQNPTPTITIKSHTVNGADEIVMGTVTDISHSATQSNRRYTLKSVSFKIQDILISGSSLTDNTTIILVVTIKYGNTSKDYTVQYELSNVK